MGDGSPRLNSKGKGRAPQNGDIVFLSDTKDVESKNGNVFLHEGIYKDGKIYHLSSEPGVVAWEPLDAPGLQRFNVQKYVRPPAK